LQMLPLLEGRKINGAILLATAISPAFDTTPARRHAENGFWSFHSPFDWVQLGFGTLAFGTFDGKHSISAGMLGFREIVSGDVTPPNDDIAPLRQICYRFAMLKSGHCGGHYGCANRLFAAEWLAPIVMEASSSAQDETRETAQR